jgi:hypothetical protein
MTLIHFKMIVLSKILGLIKAKGHTKAECPHAAEGLGFYACFGPLTILTSSITETPSMYLPILSFMG